MKRVVDNGHIHAAIDRVFLFSNWCNGDAVNIEYMYWVLCINYQELLNGNEKLAIPIINKLVEILTLCMQNVYLCQLRTEGK